MNLSNVVAIRHKLIEVYPDERTKPACNHGLNVAAKLTFFKLFKTKKDEADAVFESKLRRWVGRMPNASFESYDPSLGHLHIKILNF